MIMLVIEADDVLAADTLKRLRRLSKGMERLRGIDRVLSPFTLKDIRAQGDQLLVDPAVKRIPRTAESREKLRQEIVRIMDMPYEGKQKTRHILDIIYHDVGLEIIKEKVVNPLKGLKVVSYYGCLLVRPPKVTEFGEHENPVLMDEIMEAIGAEPLDWSGKIDCCGGSLALTRTDIVCKLVEDLKVAARKAGANCIVTACPLCQANVDTRQKGSKDELLPIFYFSELMGLAFKLSDTNKWFKKHVISPFQLLREHKLI